MRGWFNHYHRLSKDYERLPEMSEAAIYAVMTRIMLRHLIVDTQGLLLSVVVSEANGQDRVGAAAALMEETCDCSSLELI
jgi:transposase